MIELRDVSKEYASGARGVRALDRASVSVGAGEFVAVCGPSGCGKSTLLMVVGGLLRASEGMVSVAESRLDSLTSRALNRFRAQKIGFVFQTFHLLPYFSVIDNVLAAADGSSAEVVARANGLLDRFGLADRRQHLPGQLSAGERQRVAVARALINNPPIVLADEPTGNLDAENGRTVLGLLADYHRQGGTVMLVTHDAAAAGFAQRTIKLDRGRIVA